MTQTDSNELVKNEPVSVDKAVDILKANELPSAVAKPPVKEGEGKPLPVMQEETRSDLAKFLIYGFAATIAGVFAIILIDKISYYSAKDEMKEKIKDQTGTKDLITLVLTTQSTLVGAAIGFYFGTRDTK
jgi:hypothetical protein